MAAAVAAALYNYYDYNLASLEALYGAGGAGVEMHKKPFHISTANGSPEALNHLHNDQVSEHIFLNFLSTFLVACSQFYNLLCWSVGLP